MSEGEARESRGGVCAGEGAGVSEEAGVQRGGREEAWRRQGCREEAGVPEEAGVERGGREEAGVQRGGKCALRRQGCREEAGVPRGGRCNHRRQGCPLAFSLGCCLPRS